MFYPSDIEEERSYPTDYYSLIYDDQLRRINTKNYNPLKHKINDIDLKEVD